MNTMSSFRQFLLAGSALLAAAAVPVMAEASSEQSPSAPVCLAAQPTSAAAADPAAEMQKRVDALNCEMQTRIAGIELRYKPDLDSLGRDRPRDPNIGQVGGITGYQPRFRQRPEKISLHLPTVAMRYRPMWADVPQVFSERLTILIPEVYTENQTFKCGQYPEVHGLRIVWKDIICSSPIVRTRQRPAHFDRPVIRIQRADFGMHLPDVRWEQVEISVLVPELVIDERDKEIARVNEEAAAIQERAQAVSARMRAEIEAVVAEYRPRFAAVAAGASSASGGDAKARVAAAFDQAIAQFEAAVAQIRAAGAEVPAEMSADLARLRAERATAVANAERAAGA